MWWVEFEDANNIYALGDSAALSDAQKAHVGGEDEGWTKADFMLG